MRTTQGMRRGLLAAAMAVLSAAAHADGYPTKPIRLIAPFAPGGTVDIVSRIVAQTLTEAWGEQVVVDNRGGAGGIIGTELAARAPADGYTLVIGHVGTLAMNPSLYPKLPYDPVKDLAPISLIVKAPNAVVVHPSVQAQSIAQLIELARAKPGALLYASAGAGSSTHLATVYFELLAKVKLTHVPYKGAGPALVDLLAGQASMMIPGVAPALPYVKAGKLRMLAVTSGNRLSTLPDVPTVIEAGLPGYEAINWLGLLAPAHTPADVVAKLNAAVRKGITERDVSARLTSLGLEVAGSTPQAFGQWIRSEIARWRPVIKASGAQTH